MFQKIKENKFVIAEILTIAWAVQGMIKNYRIPVLFEEDKYYISPVLAYFLSAVLILYLLNKYKSK